jgi:hypothetical protein
MGLIYAIESEAGANLVYNPSTEATITGWSAMAGSIAQSAIYARYGIYSVAYTPAAGVNDGTYYLTDNNLASGTTYTVSVYVLGVNGVPYKFYFADTGGTLKGTAYTWVGNGDWKRVKVTWAADANAKFRLYVTKNNDASTAVFYVDGLQLEAADHATTYMDGDQPGCAWTGAKNNSTTTRSVNTRLGGRIRDLADYSFYMQNHTGFGAPPVSNQITPYARIKGGLYSFSKKNPRVITINGVLIGTSLADYWTKRALLWNMINPTYGPVLLRYTGGVYVQQAVALYDSGFEGGKLDGFSETMSIRFMCPDPDLFQVDGGE